MTCVGDEAFNIAHTSLQPLPLGKSAEVYQPLLGDLSVYHVGT